MAEQPSYRSSTLAQAFIAALVFYMFFLLLVAVGVIFCHVALEIAEKLVGWASALFGVVSGAYLAARKVNGEGKPKEDGHAATPQG